MRDGQPEASIPLLGPAMSPGSASHRPKHAYRGPKTSHYHWGQLQAHAYAFHGMNLIVSVMTLPGWQNCL